MWNLRDFEKIVFKIRITYRQNTVPINLDADNSERANVIDNVWTEA